MDALIFESRLVLFTMVLKERNVLNDQSTNSTQMSHLDKIDLTMQNIKRDNSDSDMFSFKLTQISSQLNKEAD